MLSYNSLTNTTTITGNLSGETPNSILITDATNTIGGLIAPDTVNRYLAAAGNAIALPSLIEYTTAATPSTIVERDNNGQINAEYFNASVNTSCEFIMSPVDNSIIIRGSAIDLIGPVHITSTLITDSTNNGFLLNSNGTGLVDVFYATEMADAKYSGMIFPYSDPNSVIFGRSSTLPGSTFPITSPLYLNMIGGNVVPGITDYFNVGATNDYYHYGYISDLYITSLNARPLPAPGTGKISLASVMDCNASERITNLLDPTAAQSAATKNYVDNAISGISIGSYLKLDCSNDPLTGALSTQNVSPNLDLTYSIGDSTHKFNSVYTIQVNSDGKDLELKTTGPSSVVSINPASNTIKMNNSNLTMIASISGNGTTSITTQSDIVPDSYGNRNLGSDLLPMNTLYTTTVRAPTTTPTDLNLYAGAGKTINVHNFQISNVAAGTSATDAANYSQITGLSSVYVAKAGDTMTGSLNLSNCSLLKSSGTVNVGLSGTPVDTVYTSTLSSPSVTTVGASISFNSKNLTSLGYLSAASQLNLNIGATTYQSLTSSASSIMVPQLAQLVINMNNSFLMQIDGIPNSTTTYVTDRNILHWTNSGTWRLYYQERLSSYYNGPGTRQAYRTITEYGNTWEVDNFTANTRTAYYTMYPGTTGIYDLGTASLAWNTLYTRALDSDGTNPIVLYANLNPSGLGSYSMGVYGSNEFGTICSRAMSSSAGLLMSAANSISLNSPIIQLSYNPSAITYVGASYINNTALPLQVTNTVANGTNWLAFNSYSGGAAQYGGLIGIDPNAFTLRTPISAFSIIRMSPSDIPTVEFNPSITNNFVPIAIPNSTITMLANPTTAGCYMGTVPGNYSALLIRSQNTISYIDLVSNNYNIYYNTRIQNINADFSITNLLGNITLNTETSSMLINFKTNNTLRFQISDTLTTSNNNIQMATNKNVYQRTLGSFLSYGEARALGTITVNVITNITYSSYIFSNAALVDSSYASNIKILRSGYYQVNAQMGLLIASSAIGTNTLAIGLGKNSTTAFFSTDTLSRYIVTGGATGAANTYILNCCISLTAGDILSMLFTISYTTAVTLYNSNLSITFLGE